MLKQLTSRPLQTVSDISSTFDYSIHDPLLTEFGESQARSLASASPFPPNALLVSSPLRRTLQTALMGFNRPPLPHPGFQENSAKPCDTGSPREVLEQEFPELNFGLVVDGWDSKEGEWSPDETSLALRAGRMREWLKKREEDEIIVVTHGGFLLYLVEEIRGFENAEYRSYTFADSEEAVLIPLEIERQKVQDTTGEKEDKV